MASSSTNPTSPGPVTSRSFHNPIPVRRDSSSTFSSEAYSPLPPGRWTVNLHGNCSKCHHHHSHALFRIKVPKDTTISTHVNCQRCQQKWLVIGGPNATQLSLLSTETIGPDPAAARIQYSLVNMIRPMTALATLSPVLAGIAESSAKPSRKPSIHVSLTDQFGDEGSAALPPRISLRLSQRQECAPQQSPQPARLLAEPSLRPNTTQRYSLMTGRRVSNLKENLTMRFPGLHRASLRSRLGSIRQSKLSARRLGKQPATDPLVSEVVASAASASQDVITTEALDAELQSEVLQEKSRSIKSLATSDGAAARFLDNLAKDQTNLDSLTEKEKAAWVRARYTEFKENYQNSTRVVGSSSLMASDATCGESRQGQSLNSEWQRGRQPHELDGLGSHFGAFDEFWPNQPSPGTGSFSISSDRTSDCETAVDNATAIRAPRYTEVDRLQRERHGSRSPGPDPVTAHTMRRLRRNEIRFSMDSAVIREAVRSTSRPRSAATDRHSQGSAPRSSLHLTLSHTSLASR